MRIATMPSKAQAPDFRSEAVRLRALAAQVTTPQMRDRLIALASEIFRRKDGE